MLQSYGEERLLDLKAELVEIRENVMAAPQKTVDLLAAVRTAMEEVTLKVKETGFASKAEEAVFNKTVYTELYACYMYEVERFNTEETKPHTSVKAIKSHYRKKLGAMELYFLQYRLLYEVYLKELDELDGMLFVKGENVKALFLPESPEFHEAGVPPAVYVFARFKAYEKLYKEVLGQLEPNLVITKVSSALKWTASKVGIAELAYGLYYTGQFNNGNADVKEISAWLEESLGIDMDSVHRKFTDVRRRNTASPTKLLDRMREAIHQRIDEDLRHKPNRGVKLKKPLSDNENEEDEKKF